MSTSKISTFEAISLVVTVFVSHLVVSLPRDLILTTKSATIINLIYVGIIAILFVLLICKLIKQFPGYDIIDVSEYLGGRIFKTLIGCILIFYLLFSSSILLRNFCECLKIVYYPMTSIIFIILAFIVSTALSGKLKFSSMSKVNLIILPLVIFSLLFIFFANMKNFTTVNIFPILGDGFFNTFVTGLGNLGAFGGIIVLYFLPPKLKEPGKFKKIALTAIGIALILLIVCISTILFMFSFLISVDEIMPLYSAARQIEFGAFFQRLEAVFLLLWILEISCYLSLALYFSMDIFQKITNIQTSKPLSSIFSLLLLAIALISPNYSVSKFLDSTVYMTLVIGLCFVLRPFYFNTCQLEKT